MVTRRTAEETARLGDEIYERAIRQEVEADHHGAVVAIDVESGIWAIGDNVIAATDSLRMQRPDAVDVWRLRVWGPYAPSLRRPSPEKRRWAPRHQAQGYRLKSTSKVVLATETCA